METVKFTSDLFKSIKVFNISVYNNDILSGDSISRMDVIEVLNSRLTNDANEFEADDILDFRISDKFDDALTDYIRVGFVPDYIETFFKDVFGDEIESVRFDNYIQPKYYNYTDDEIYFSVTFRNDPFKLALAVLNNMDTTEIDSLNDYLSQYGDRDGFWSYTPSNIGQLKDKLAEGDVNAISVFCDYRILQSEEFKSITDPLVSLYDDLTWYNCLPEYYLEAQIKGVNEEEFWEISDIVLNK
jgi:hypothetical protein